MAVRIESQAEPIPGYKLLERLGGGGFGEVWKAVAPGGIFKAIKFVYGDVETSGGDGQRAVQELKALSRVKSVRHPYILSLERFDIIQNQLIIVMELADRNLWDRFRECRAQGLQGIPREELLGYMAEAAEALDLMNIEYQLQHLDIKPQNLFLVYNHAKVADFGLVKDLEGMMAAVTGGVTPVYAAPETFDGWVSRFCDQYSLAIVYQELLTGQRPFTGTNVRQLILQHLQGTPNLGPLPPCDRDPIGQALSKKPDSRFPRCLDLVKALRSGTESTTAQTTKGPEEARQETQPAHSTHSQETTPHGDEYNGASGADSYSNDPSPELPPPQTTAATCWIRVPEGAEVKAVEKTPAPAAPPVIHGDGVLFPALVVGLGNLGLQVLQRLRQTLHDRFGALSAVPSTRLLYVDTDPDALRLAAQGGTGQALGPGEILLAKLNRPRHYMRPDDRERIESCFDMKMLYRIPRNPVTTGLRALGRLAFLDNYRAITRRLRSELQDCTQPNQLTVAGQHTGLGMRTNRPRVYVITGLAGGTGSGMFLDLAYVLRNVLAEQGYEQQEVIGFFLLPGVDRNPERTTALGNAFAALTELNHYSIPGAKFYAQYEDKGTFSASGPPFSRCVLLPLPEVSDEGALRERVSMTADFLLRDLTTPLGRAADETRAGHCASTPSSKGLTCQTFGLYRISWPRQALLRRVARQLCQKLAQRWLSKDASPIRQTVQTLVAEEWTRQQLGGEQVLAELQKTCEVVLGQPPQAAFADVTEPLGQLTADRLDTLRSTAAKVLERLEQVVGRPGEYVGGRMGIFVEPLQSQSEALVATWGKSLAQFAAQLIERPGLRLAGAEEAIRRLIAQIEEALAQHENSFKEFTQKTSEGYARIESMLASISTVQAKRALPMVNTLVDLIRSYPHWRYQSLLLQRVVQIYVSVRGNLSDQLREVNYCRTRLHELQRSFESPARRGAASEEVACGRDVFKPGCRNLNDAVKQLFDSITEEDFAQLDAQVQTIISQQFQGLVNVCLTSSNLLDNLEDAMQREVEQAVAARLEGIDVAEMFLAQHATETEACDNLVAAFDEAAPELSFHRSGPQQEICLLASPSGPTGERFRSLARQAVPETELVLVPSPDDIILYRELPVVRLADLEQVGPLAFEAYRLMSSVEHFTPHSRIDVKEWRAASG